MSREILIRGKRVIDGKWAESCCPLGEMHSGTVTYDFDSETVCQYTGLTDKNGRKIFEGDIVKGIAYSSDFVGYIIWIEEIAGFGVRYFNTHREPTAWENSSILKAIQARRKDQFAAEVIGNIFDTPELMEGGAE